MTTSYDVRRSDWLIVFGVAVYLCVTRASRTICVAILIAIAIGCVVAQSRSLISRSLASCLILIFAFGAINSQRARNDFADVQLGEFDGYATVISDPQNIGVATRTTLEIGHDRFGVYAYGRPAWRLAGAKVGEQVYVRGLRESFEQRTESRWVAQHIKGKFRLEFVGETRLVASPILRSVQRVRDLVKLGSDSFE
ncbi:MAG: hypothetical protein ACKO2A_06720, partial [Acidimicrobiaceae bacterium]